MSIVVPVLDDAAALADLLKQLESFRRAGAEVIVVDGGSRDGGPAIAEQCGAVVLRSPPGRGLQLNTGVRQARGDWLWLLHADSQVPAAALEFLLELEVPAWGRFDVRFDDDGAVMRIIACMMNARSRLTGVCTGDQGIFVHRRLLERIHGVPELPLMEDVALTNRLKRLTRPLAPRLALGTSARRWRQRGVLRTVLEMWRLRLAYWLGAEPARLAAEYYGRGPAAVRDNGV